MASVTFMVGILTFTPDITNFNIDQLNNVAWKPNGNLYWSAPNSNDINVFSLCQKTQFWEYWGGNFFDDDNDISSIKTELCRAFPYERLFYNPNQNQGQSCSTVEYTIELHFYDNTNNICNGDTKAIIKGEDSMGMIIILAESCVDLTLTNVVHFEPTVQSLGLCANLIENLLMTPIMTAVCTDTGSGPQYTPDATCYADIKSPIFTINISTLLDNVGINQYI